jgi:RES domain-containing protein
VRRFRDRGRFVKSPRPSAVNFDGTVHRYVDRKYISGAWDIHPGNVANHHRFSAPGRGALYSGTSREAILAELRHYKGNPADVAFVQRYIEADDILDLTNPTVRSDLGVSLADLVSDSYSHTQALGDFARTRYRGMLVPSARRAGVSHLVLFK